MEWCPSSDSPESPLMPEELFRKFYSVKYGLRGTYDLELGLRRAKKFGTSVAGLGSVARILNHNRAGKNSKRIPVPTLVKKSTIDNEDDLDIYLKRLKQEYEEMINDLIPDYNL